MTSTPQTPAGWYADPTGRYTYRWYDGRDWTGHVVTPDGATGTDPAWTSPAAPTPTGYGQTVGTGPAPAGPGAQIVFGPRLIGAIVGALAILIGGFALPWYSFSGFSSLDMSLTDLITTDDSGLFITSKIFWGGAVIGLLLLSAAGAIAAAFRASLRVAAILIGILALLWQLSATLMTIGRGWADDSLQVDMSWFEGWGSGLWLTTIGLIVVIVAPMLPPTTAPRRAGV